MKGGAGRTLVRLVSIPVTAYLALALTLHQIGVPCQVLEAVPA